MYFYLLFYHHNPCSMATHKNRQTHWQDKHIQDRTREDRKEGKMGKGTKKNMCIVQSYSKISGRQLIGSMLLQWRSENGSHLFILSDLTFSSEMSCTVFVFTYCVYFSFSLYEPIHIFLSLNLFCLANGSASRGSDV